MISRIWNHPTTFMALMAAPAIAMSIGWTRGDEYGQLMHGSGEFSARFLVLSLLLSPLALFFRTRGWLRWLRKRRRHIGVAAFLYALLHAVFYLEETGSLSKIASDLAVAVVWTGWLPFLFMVPLAVTSTESSVRKLGSRWFVLHRLAYPAVALSALHWYLVDKSLGPVLVHFLPLLVLEIVRLARRPGAAASLGTAVEIEDPS